MKAEFLLLAVALTVAAVIAAAEGREVVKAEAALGYSGNSIENHHNIPRDQYSSSHGGGGGSTGQLPPYGDEGGGQGSGGSGGTN